MPLDEALAAMSRYSTESKILKKSTTPFEGKYFRFLLIIDLLRVAGLVEGDVVFLGKPDNHVQLLRFVPESGSENSRPHSVASNDGIAASGSGQSD